MNEKSIAFVGRTTCAVVSMLILGEVLGNAVSKPITAWRSKGINKSKLSDLISSMNQRICDLEEKKETEAE